MDKKDTAIWDETIWIATYGDVAMVYRDIHGMAHDEPLSEEQEERVLQIARNAEKSFVPHDWEYQLKVFVEESERWMDEDGPRG